MSSRPDDDQGFKPFFLQDLFQVRPEEFIRSRRDDRFSA